MTKKLVVSDSSTLILIVKAEFFEVVAKTIKVVIPKIVFEESVSKGKETGRWDSLKIEGFIKENLIKVEEPTDANLEKVSKNFGLHRGELHAIALALDIKAEFLLTDDLKAMNACKILEIKFVNAISLLLSMQENGNMDKKTAKMAFIKLKEFGWYSPTLIAEYELSFKEMEK